MPLNWLEIKLSNNLTDSAYLVTGASSGIGESVALKLNSLGFRVIAIARDTERLQRLLQKVSYPELLHIEIKDLTQEVEALPAFVTSLKEKYGKLQGLIYCAGMPDLSPLRIVNYAASKALFDINYFAPLFLTKGILDKRNNTGNNVCVIAIASIEALLCDRGMSVYAASKSALIASMKCIAKEYFAQGIRVNTISPGYVNTPLLDKIRQQKEINKSSSHVLEPHEIADAVEFILLKAPHMSGSDILIGGGSLYQVN